MPDIIPLQSEFENTPSSPAPETDAPPELTILDSVLEVSPDELGAINVQFATRLAAFIFGIVGAIGFYISILNYHARNIQEAHANTAISVGGLAVSALLAATGIVGSPPDRRG